MPGCLGKPWLAGEGPALRGVTTLLVSLGRFGGGCRSERPGRGGGGGGGMHCIYSMCAAKSVQLWFCGCIGDRNVVNGPQRWCLM